MNPQSKCVPACTAHTAARALLATLLLLSAGSAYAYEPPGKVLPGQTITLSFDGLGSTWHDPVTKAQVYIPADYDRTKTTPLLVWFADDMGSHEVAPATRITGGGGFVCVAVPYLEPAEYNRENKGGWHTAWSYYDAILDRVHRTVPNLDPERRVAAGYGSGAYAITWHLANSPEFARYFTAYAIGGGGSNLGRLESIRGRPMLLYLGEHDEHAGAIQSLYSAARKDRVRADLLMFHNVGDELSADHYTLVGQWLNRQVRHPWLATQAEILDRQLIDGRYTEALPTIRRVLDEVDPSMPEYAQAESALAAVRLHARTTEANLLASNPSPRELESFIAKWDPCRCTDQARAKFDQILSSRLEGILSMPPNLAIPRLRDFLQGNQAYPVHQQALAALDGYARPELEPIMKLPNDRLRAKHLKTFISKWSPAPSVKVAQQERNRIAQALLDEAAAIPQAALRERRVRAVIRQFPDTLAAELAKEKLTTRTPRRRNVGG